MPKTDISVGDLVSMIERGELKLPEMQRRYVWTSTRVRDLLDSLYRGYPSGTILVWETDVEHPTREIAVSHHSSPFGARKLLLDGQQRLTSLSAVIRGEPVEVRNRRRSIDIAFNLDHPDAPPSDLPEIEDDLTQPTRLDMEDASDDETDAEERAEDVFERLKDRTFVVAFNALFTRPNWIRVSEVFKGDKPDWHFIRNLVHSPDDPRYAKYQERLNRLRKIRDYSYVMQVLPREKSYNEVAEIFVRVNSLGAKLRGSDLALAQITARWPNSLRKLEDFMEECESRSWFTLDTSLLVRLIVVFSTQQCRFKTVGSIPLNTLEDSWKRTQQGINFAINFLRTNADIEDESLLSSVFLVIPIAVYGDLRKYVISLEEQRALLQWLYLANCRGHYSMSSESTLDADLSVLFRGRTFNDLLEPLLRKYGRLHIEANDFTGRGERNPLFSITYLALKHAGAKDWKTGLGLSLTHQGHLHYIEYHHIFPKSLLREAKYEKTEINEIANMAFISGRTNRTISNKAPCEYFPKIIQDRGADALSSQAIPLDERFWQVERFREFLERRRAALAAAVNGYMKASTQAGKASGIHLST
jgi:hypothetical protein